MESGSTAARISSWAATIPISIVTLVAANLVPLVGVLFLGWSIATILVLYWVESGVVGLLNIPKILLARGPILVENRGLSLAIPLASTGTLGELARLLMCGFFLIHYGIFWIAHGFFVFLLPTITRSREGVQGLGATSGVNTPGIDAAVILPAAGLLLLSHAVSFATNYIGRREFLRVSPIRQMFAPYSRVTVMHVTILFGAFLAMLLGSPLWTLVVMVLVKTGMDLRLHGREHERASVRPGGP